MWPCRKMLPQVLARWSDQQVLGRNGTGRGSGCWAGKAVGGSNQGALQGLGKHHYALGRPKGLQGLSGVQAVQGANPCGFA